MLDHKQLILLLDQAKYLFLCQISEPEETSLRLVVQEAIVDRYATGSATEPSAPFADLLQDSSPIRSTQGCKTFELRWPRYVAYLVTEEVTGSGGSSEEEIYTGNLFRAYAKSQFLNYLSHNTGGHTEPILHYKLLCQNHLIDVASYWPPQIRLLDAAWETDGAEQKPN